MFYFCLQGESLAFSANEVQLRIYNHLNCRVAISDPLVGNFSIDPYDVFRTDMSPELNRTHVLSIDADPECQLKTYTQKQYVLTVKGKVKRTTILIHHHSACLLILNYIRLCIYFTSGFFLFFNA